MKSLEQNEKERTMSKLTSADIKWEDGKNFAVVDKLNNRTIEQHKAYNGLSSDLDEHGYFNEFDDGEYAYHADYYYLVERENKKTVVDAVNFMRAKTPVWDLFYDKSCGELTYDIKRGKYGYKICTVSEYNHCVKELSEATWMNDGEPQSYEAHKKWFKEFKPSATFELGDTCYHHEIKGPAVYLSKDPKFDTGSYILPDESSVPIAVTTMLLTTEPPAPTTEQVLEETAKALYELAIAPDKQPCWEDSIGYMKTIFRTLADSGVKLPESK
jgi:hypothetical protein